MQPHTDKSHRLDEIKTQFKAREGYYRLMNSPDYSQRSQRAMGFGTGTANSNSSIASHEKTSIKISLVKIGEHQSSNALRTQQEGHNCPESISFKLHRKCKTVRDMKICFNVGKELFVYNYDGVKAGPDASNPIYKRSYKGSAPTCHDFNQATASTGSICLLVGFSHGQVQLIDLNGCDEQEACKEFNVDRLIDKSRVTCIKWLPNSSSLFLVAHASGQLYLYKDDLPCGPSAPVYHLYKQSEGVMIYTCKTKTSRNPIYKWSIGTANGSSNMLNSSSSLHKSDNESCSLNEFVFSPCAKYLACVSQDGFLRVYCYDTMELIGRARSYYGGLLCVCWSPDGKYVVTGGEDDLITVWSFVERRVLARGTGHKSWVSVVAFDSYYSGCDLNNSDVDNYDDEDDEDVKEVMANDLECDDEGTDDIEEFGPTIRIDDGCDLGSDSKSSIRNCDQNNQVSPNTNHQKMSSSPMTSYRFGSVGQDAQLCLWDLSDDLLQQPIVKSRTSCVGYATNSVNFSPLIQNHSQKTINYSSLKSDNVQEQTDRESSDKQIEFSSSNFNHQDTNSLKPISFGSTLGASSSGLLSSKGSGFTKTFSLVGRRDKSYFSHRVSTKNSDSKTNNTSQTINGDPSRLIEDPLRLLGSPICPRMNEVPVIEPTVCKKISFERLTSLIFCHGGFITSCQDGYVFSWARPSRRTQRISPGQSNEELRVIDVGTSSAV